LRHQERMLSCVTVMPAPPGSVPRPSGSG
jgi:hypothetical protein